ncbi:MAG: hypothetical protein H7Z39_15505, partial [Burkholderiaceae bacterium]|nr:hypothetical protein [Burkholderiaceae bacterium]
MHFSNSDLIPQFKPSLRVAAVDADLLLVLSERQRSVIRGRAIAQVAQMIDGARSA